MDISVIIPLIETRGRALDSITSWTHQELARDRYEVLVVGDGSDAGFRGQVEEKLGSAGRFIESAERGGAGLYNLGARHARAPFLFITESHCVGHPKCLERVLEFIESRGLDVAICGSNGLPGNLFSRMEQRLFEAELAERKAAASGAISVRGTAIRRERFLAAGGFDERYGHFSEVLLGDTLAAQGARVGFADDALVLHENVTDASELIKTVIQYGRDDCRRASDGVSPARRCQVWDQREMWTKSVARARLAALIRHAPRLLAGGDAKTVVRTFAELLAPSIAGVNGRIWASRAGLWWTRVRLSRAAKNPEVYFELYRHLWRSAIRHGSYEFLTDDGTSTPVSAAPFHLGKADERLIGFHEVERGVRGAFRWSEPVALVRLAIEPDDYDVSIRLARPCRDSVDSLGIFFDGQRLAALQRQTEPPRIAFAIPRALVKPGRSHELVLVCRSYPLDPRADARALGLPVTGIEVTASRAAL